MQCSRCLRDNSADASTCVVCGQRLAAAATRAAPSDGDAATGERRQLTVVFSDIVGSTVLADRLDAEDLRELIRAYQDVTVSATHRFGGTVAQYLGDGMIVYFGYPHALEDAAHRAVRATLAMLDGMQDLNARLEREYGVRLAIRLGVHTGYAVVAELIGDSGRDISPVGDTMHIASRLCDIAAVDSILVSDATQRLVQGFFECVPVGAARLKGIGKPVETHRVLGPSSVRSRFEAAASRGLTPFIGRDPESRALDACWAAAASGQGRVVLVTGEAGIGKSRLIHELRERLTVSAGQSLLAACTAQGDASAFHPILDLVEQILGFATERRATERRARLDEALAIVGEGSPAAAPLIARLLGLPPGEADTRQELSPEAERRRLIAALAGLLLLRVRDGAVLLTVEDLHWADASTIELLEELIRRVGALPVLLILSTRPDFVHDWPQPPDSRMALERLLPEDARLLVRAMSVADPLPSGVVDDLVRMTDGVPLFLEEFTRTVAQSAALRLLSAGPLSSRPEGVPSTLRDLLMARLDHLGPTKDVAQLAAVLGRTFDVDVLAAVAGTTVEALQPDLARLAAADLIFEEGRERRGSYFFKHALLRDAAYDALLRRRRRELHERVARTLERDFPETATTHPEVLAYHLTAAMLLEEAIGWWERAAQHAIASYAGEEAIRHLTRALELLDQLSAAGATLAREADLRVALCRVLYMVKGTGAPEVGEALVRARDVCERAQRHSDLHSILYMLAGFHNLRAEYQAGQRVAQDALVLADASSTWAGPFPPSMARAAHLGTLGAALMMSGDFVRCLEISRAGIAAGANTDGFVVQVGMAHPAVVANSQVSMALWMLGFPDQAVATVARGVELVSRDDTSHSYSLCFAQLYIALVRLHRRESELALAEADRLVALARERGMQYWLDTGRFLRGGALVLAGDGAAALAALEAGLEGSQGSETRIGTSMWLGIFAAACLQVGQNDAALGWVRAALAFAEERGERGWYPELCRLEGMLLLAADPSAMEAAESRFREALRAARMQGGRAWELRAATSLAALVRGTSRAAEAYEALASAYAGFTEGFDTPDLVEARTLLTELAG